MSKDDKVMYILSGVRWNFTWQRHHAIAQIGAERGYRVFYIEPAPRGVMHVLSFLRARIRKQSGVATLTQEHIDGVTVISALNFSISVILRRLPRPDLSVFYVPSLWSWMALWLVGSKMPVYDHVVDWRCAPRDWFPPRGAELVERLIATRARSGKAAVSTDSAVLQERWTRRGVSCEVVLPAADAQFVDFEWGDGDATSIGYFGSIRESEIETRAFIELEAKGYSVYLIGPIDEKARKALDRSAVSYRSAVQVGDLPGIVEDWGAIVLPYKTTERASSLVPAKLWNCLATRKPVLVRGIDLPSELHRYEVASPVAGFRAFVVPPTIDEFPNWGNRFDQIERLGGLAG